MNKTKIIAVTNSKGGTGKTTLSINIAGTLAELNQKVLLIDLDAQGNLSSFFIENIYNLQYTIRDLILSELESSKAIIKTEFEDIDIIPSNLTLADLDSKLAGVDDAQFLLQEAIKDSVDKYDYIIIDCPPSLSRATKMALVAATDFIVPIEAQQWSIIGAEQLFAFVESIKKRANPNLNFIGFVLNKLTGRRKIETEYCEILQQRYPGKVINTVIKNMVAFSEAVSAGQPINFYASKSVEAETMRNLVKEILNHGKEII